MLLIDSTLLPLLRAAESGDCHALSEIGKRYFYGEGVPQSYYMARVYYEKLANTDNPPDDFASFELIILVVGDLYYIEKNYKASLEFYQRGKDFILANNPWDVAIQKLCRHKVDAEIRSCYP